ncbi:hypothetical protein FDZ58_02000 [Ehrlichia ruminantium]|uniref:hypothetical protein n=1 Tax=Ehrlichia ruminantium TaxID=779 RepID=UPI0015DC6682|nr:hypothetical protein [Ehrlichia ruminantium]QLK50434.1 hypothetical protein FDZ68_01990 [Ehrlichia ruminantium]QLK51359.1 hypothetical protein FDZ66_01995 [Ehrlichia ruminantium]QLK53194.1 hypothetical protein FDZ64_01995 [Ehrlichia ruminantium]QLK58696.1 hypothetical protein FDZ58_02000 [Ehrlichia ruminantium]
MIVSRNNGIKVACIVAVVSSLIIVQVLKSMGIIKDNEAEILSIVISIILIAGIAAVLFQCMCTNGITLETLDSLSKNDSHVADGDIDTSDIAEVCGAVDPEENCLGKDESPASTSGQNNASEGDSLNEGELPRVAPSQDHAFQDRLSTAPAQNDTSKGSGLPRVAPIQNDPSKDGLPRVAPSQDHDSKDELPTAPIQNDTSKGGGLPIVAPVQNDTSKDGLPTAPIQNDTSKGSGLPIVAPVQNDTSKGSGLPIVAPVQNDTSKGSGLPIVAPVQNDASKDGLPTAPAQNDTSKGGGLPTVAPVQNDTSKGGGLPIVAPVQNDTSKDGLPTAPIQNDTSKGSGLPRVAPVQNDTSKDDFLEGLLESMFSENVTDVRYNEESDGNVIDQDQLLGDGKKSSDDSGNDDKSCERPKIKPFLSVTTAVSPTGDNDLNLIDLGEDEKSDQEAGQSCSPGLLYNVKLCERRHMNVLM